MIFINVDHINKCHKFVTHCDSPITHIITTVPVCLVSGHTHGGQMFPFHLAVYFLNPFYRGLYVYKGKHVYVNEGTQFWGFPVRLGTTMEITDIALTMSNAKK